MKRRTFLMGSGAVVTAALMGGRVAFAGRLPNELVWADDLPGSLDPHAMSDVPIVDGIVTSYSVETRCFAIVLTSAVVGDVDLRIRVLH